MATLYDSYSAKFYIARLKSLYYFFFPPTNKVWADGASGIDIAGRVFHKHYTFRNFAVHWLNTLTDNTQEAKERWKFYIGYEPRFGWVVGAIVFDAAIAQGGTSGSTITVSHTNSG